MSGDPNFGKRMVILRKGKGLSQKQAAKDIGISISAYQTYEYGHLPTLRILNKIVDFYKCSERWLLTGEGDPYSEAEGSENLIYMTPAHKILEEAIRETGVDLNEAQKMALLGILKDELARTGDKIKEVIRAFKKEGGA